MTAAEQLTRALLSDAERWRETAGHLSVTNLGTATPSITAAANALYRAGRELHRVSEPGR